ncbi:hypothetical protein ABZ234_17540 [Nocardiopsis sp. NPDC006198]|uniref:hypothetical protein n=1 Tax=Nocardiopsis sp. NPDC006198 TaxID=3154472 RepID=UPI0033AD7922
MRRVDSEELDYLDEISVRIPGGSFTGQAVEKDGRFTHYQTFVKGYALGPVFLLNERGVALEYSNRVGNISLGPYFFWDENGRLREEGVSDYSDGSLRVLRRWDEAGILVHFEENPPRAPFVDPETGENLFRPWRSVPSHPGIPGREGYVEAVGMGELDFEGRVTYQGAAYTGEAVLVEGSGRAEMRTFVEGAEDGPFLVWSPSGKLVTQGVTRDPYGPVGPWHEWNEEGRLLSETIYDALGNRIIFRGMDEAGNIAKEEVFPPERLLRDPETGEERPAPWL